MAFKVVHYGCHGWREREGAGAGTCSPATPSLQNFGLCGTSNA